MENKLETEKIAKELHEAGREAVEKKAVVNPNTHNHFLEWNELTENQKDGRRFIAKKLLEKYKLVLK